MSKIRINELARQLEVPSHVIVDLLPDLGVTEKKTHSSSIDDATADLVRKRVQGVDEPAVQPEVPAVAVAEPEQIEMQRAALRAVGEQPAVAAKGAPVPAAEAPAPPSENGSLPAAAEEVSRAKPAPIRPPLAAGGSAPLHPPLRTG